MEEKPLYEDSKLVIDYSISHPEDHLLIIKELDQEYILPRGTLKELATCHVNKVSKKVVNLDGELFLNISKSFLGVDYFGLACSRAYIEEERRIERFKREISS